MRQTGEMRSPQDSAGQILINALRGACPRARNDAIASLLTEHGITFEPTSDGVPVLPAGGRVNEQRASVVQQAAAELWEDLDSVLSQCRSDEELRRLFAGMISRRRLDRRRRVKNMQPGMETAGMPEGPPAWGSATGSIGARQNDTRLYHEHVSRLLEAAGPDRLMIELYVIKQADWRAIAATMQITEGSLRTRFSRLRERLSTVVYRDLIGVLDSETAAVAVALFIRGEHMADVAERCGQSGDQIKRLVTNVILPAVREHFGPSFVALLPRLRRRAPTSTGQGPGDVES